MSESHLVYNVMSLLWKVIQLETSMGSVKFASMVAALLGMSQGIPLILAKSLLLLFDHERAYYHEYSVGFSGVLFAMKVVLNFQSDNYTSVHGLGLPSRHAAWAELILIQMFVPGVSFLGHLGGILAGILYLRLKASYSGGTVGGSHTRSATGVWRCRACTFDNSDRFDDGQSSPGSSNQTHDLPMEELWRRRVQRFGR
ncbi:unnamed protein product [Ilex paraguariensis]|uniref:Peptidase S54 rhomboid domain-containing protein n=1 Tax=Ilex paraguariensis TaxID=185542 RepID=A0ABC8R7J3_9AQUA